MVWMGGGGHCAKSHKHTRLTNWFRSVRALRSITGPLEPNSNKINESTKEQQQEQEHPEDVA